MRIGNVSIDKAVEKSVIPIGTDTADCLFSTPLPENIFHNGRYISFTTRDSIVFTEVRSESIDTESVLDIYNLGSSIKFTFQMQSQPSEVQLGEDRKWIKYQPGASHTLSPLIHSGKLRVEPGTELRQSTLFIPKKRLISLLEDYTQIIPELLKKLLYRPSKCPLVVSRPMTPQMNMIFQDVHACPMRGSLGRAYLEAKVNELVFLRLYEEIRYSIGESPNHPVKLTKNDVSKIGEAATVIHNRLDNPPSLHELGKIVRLNVNKLKYGFRHIYGTSVFSYMHSLRMRQAYVMLQDTNLNVTEVSEKIGYSRQSAFSVAFKREFGFSPREVKK